MSLKHCRLHLAMGMTYICHLGWGRTYVWWAKYKLFLWHTCATQKVDLGPAQIIPHDYLDNMVNFGQRTYSNAFSKMTMLVFGSKLKQENLRDLIVATGLVIFKLDSNLQFFNPCDIEIWWMTLESNRAPLLYYISFSHQFKSISGFTLKLQPGNIQLGSKLVIFVSRVTLKFDKWPSKSIGHICCTTSSSLHHFKAIGEFKLRKRSIQFGSKSVIFCPVWPWNLTVELGKQYDTSSMFLQALCIIS